MAINVKDKLVTVESLGIAYSTEQGARQEADQALSTRIDNIVAPDGDPSLTEVSDARVSGSTTHNTLKARLDADQAAVGTEIAELKADLGDLSDISTWSSDIELLDDYSAGGAKGTVGSSISYTTSTSYAHCSVDCSLAKEWRITTRRSNSTGYPNYIIETDASNVITAVHSGIADTSAGDTYTYTITALDTSKKIHVNVYRGGGQAGYIATIECKMANIALAIKGNSTKLVGHSERIESVEADVVSLQEQIENPYAELEKGLLDTARKKVLSYNRASGKKLINFAFMTDLHYNNYGATPTYPKDSLRLFAQMCNEGYVDFAAFGGDMYSDYNLSHDEAIETIRPVLDVFGTIKPPLYITKGNHECNGKYVPLWTGGTPDWNTYHYFVVGENGREYTEITENEYVEGMELHYSLETGTSYDSHTRFSVNDTLSDWENSMLSQARVSDKHTNNPSGDYFYVDYPNEKVRVVILNCYESSRTTARGLEQLVLTNGVKLGIYPNQIDWIENDVLNIENKSEWYILFIGHLHPTQNNGELLYSLIADYIDDGGNVLGILHGHQHKDSYYTTGVIEGQTDPFINIIGCDAGHAKQAL